MDAARLSGVVAVHRASDDADVIAFGLSVQSAKITPIESQDAAFSGCGELKNILIGNRLICLSRFVRRQNVVTESPEFDNQRQWDILVRVKGRHL
jgi:hypothetical protein